MADDKDIKIKIILNDGGTSATLKSINDQIISSKVPIQDLRKELGNFVVTSKKIQSSVNVNRKQFSALGKSVGGFTSQTGAATSATLEFGRVLSDAPYGIRGVANNLQQLASNLFFMSKGVDSATGKAIGFKGAIGGLIKNLAGPAGILVAFQGIIALFDYFSSGAKKATESTEELNVELKKEIAILEGLANISSNVNSSMDDRNNAIITAIASNKDFANSILEGNDTLTGQESSLRALLEEKKKQLVLDENIAKVNAINNTTLKDETRTVEEVEVAVFNLNEEYRKSLEIAGASQRGITQAYTTQKETLDEIILSLKKREELMQKISDLYEPPRQVVEGSVEWWKQQISFAEKTRDQLSTNNKAYKNQTLIIKGLKKELEKITDTKRKKVTAFDTSQISKDAKDYVDEVMKMEKKNALLLATNNVDKLIIERDFQFKRLALLKGDNSALISEYTKYYDTLIKTAEEKLLGEGKIDPKKPATTGDAKETAKEKFLAGLEAYMEVQQSFTSFMDGEFSRQLTIERNKTNALNNQLNERLLNENLSKDERERIQLQIGQNDEKLRKKQEQIEKKRFKLNKAANIAQATISTYLAGVRVLADPALTTRPFARVAAMTATIAAGLLSVATIARTKFQSSAGSGGTIGAAAGSNGGEGESREFNFNLAGSTQSNQLTQSIAGQLSQPIQTYVVSSEITSQQQLDLNIANTATIG